MRLKVKDLRQYLILRNIPTDTCREKEDLVDLVLCHHGLGSEEEMDASSLHSSRSQTSGFFTHPFSMSVSVSSQAELANRSGSTGNGTPLQVQELLCGLWSRIAFSVGMHGFKIKCQLVQFGVAGKVLFFISDLKTEDY